MTDIAHIKELLEKATQSGGWDWEKLSVDADGYIRVPACSYLGETMICLADTYEGSGNDCALISALLNAAPALIAAWEELQNIANADPSKWDEEMRDQFQEWAQSRARSVITKERSNENAPQS